MRHFWDSLNRKRYLFNEIYDIDTTILRFQNWFTFEYDINLERTFCTYYQTGHETFEEECISEEEYLSNQEDSSYFVYMNYNELTNRPDYNKICNEFETIINDAFIHQEQNVFLKFAQESIDQAPTEGQAKILLQTILQSLDTCSEKLTIFQSSKSLNRLQEFIAEAYSYSYLDTLKSLVKRYDNIFEQITEPFKESKPEIQHPETHKPNKHSHIFVGNAFNVWQHMFDFFGVKSSSRRDFKFMFDAMKYDKLIHNTVNQIAMLDWVDSTYGIIIEKINPKPFKEDTKRMKIYSQAKDLYSRQDI